MNGGTPVQPLGVVAQWQQKLAPLLWKLLVPKLEETVVETQAVLDELTRWTYLVQALVPSGPVTTVSEEAAVRPSEDTDCSIVTELVSLVLTVPAESLLQAFSTAARIVAPFGEPASMAVASEAARSKPDGWENVPDLVSVQEVATAAGRTKQAIFSRINKGDLSARKVGQEFLVLRSDMP